MKRFLLVFAVVCLAVVVLGRWHAYRQRLARRQAAAAQREAVERALAEVIATDEFAGERIPVDNFLRELAARSDAPLKVDRNLIGTKWHRPWIGSTFIPPGEFTLEWLLDRAAADADLGWYRLHDAIVITSPVNADKIKTPYTQVYQLPAGTASGEKISDDAAELSRLIDTTIEPDSWDEVGGPMVIRPAGGAIVLHHRPDVHRQVQRLLNGFVSSQGAPSSISLEPWPTGAQQRIFEALDRIDSVDFVDVPLNRVAEILEDRHKICIVLGRTALEEAGIPHDIPITVRISNTSLRTILHEILSFLKLTFVVREDVLQFTTPEDAESLIVRRLYDVHDLVTTGQHRPIDDLIQLLTTTIEPDSWDSVGGPGAITAFGDRWLGITQTLGVHDDVQHVLSAVRAAVKPDGASDVLLNPTAATSPAVRQVLDRLVTLSYCDTPLQEICRQLSDSLQVPVLLDKSALYEAGITEDTPLTAELPPLPLRHALTIMLRDLKLALRVTDEVIRITTAEEAESLLDIRLIDVRHLTAPGAGGIDERSLKHLIESGIQPDAWEDAGGPGSLSFFRGLLCVTHTHDVQQEVRHLIDVLSEHLLSPPTDSAAQSVWLGRSTVEEEILARLQERESLHVVDPNVEDLVRNLCARHSIPVLFRQSYRDNTDDAPLSDFAFDFKDAPLHEILTRLLKEKGGGFVAWTGVIFVTDEETAESQLRAKLYPVGPHWPAEKKLRGQEVARLLAEHVEHDSWEGVGGPGYAMPVNDQWLLVVQTLDVHRQIDEAIARLRAGQPLPEPK